jgi:D-alanine-D-alanine ligase-like ATP-grasp enzyme
MSDEDGETEVGDLDEDGEPAQVDPDEVDYKEDATMSKKRKYTKHAKSALETETLPDAVADSERKLSETELREYLFGWLWVEKNIMNKVRKEMVKDG